MKRRELERKLRIAGCYLKREGSSHALWINPRTGVTEAVPRHICDFLVTWNCRHLANASKFGHIRRVNTLLGLFVPTLLTPLEMMEGGEP